MTAGYDLDALWGYEHILRSGYAWVGISAPRVGVDQLAGWSPSRYGDLDVTGDGQFTADEMSYDVFAQAAKSLRSPVREPEPRWLPYRHLGSGSGGPGKGRSP